MRPSFLHPFAKPAAPADSFISIVSGDGVWVVDREGRRFIDATASLWYCQVGHGRVEIARAIERQLRELEAFHTFDIFTNPRADEIGDRIAELCPIADARVFLTDSGSEAVDTALKLARLSFALAGRPERTVVLARHDAYHGVTYGGTSLQGLPLNREGFGPLLPAVEHAHPHDLAEVEARFAEHGDRVAAVIAEPVLGAAGVHPPRPGYLEGLRALCDRHGALLILDEVITGFGRMGAWFAAQHYGVTPDLIVFAKGVTSGYQPLGGVVVGAKLREVLEGDPDFVLRHGFTYSGHPLACAAALANIAVLRDEDLLPRAKAIGRRLGPALAALRDQGLLAEVRGEAGIWGAGLPPDVNAAAVRDRMLELGVLARPIGTATIAFCPPLVISDAELDRCVDALARSVRAAREVTT
ncbi:aminotransferase family protein [Rhabdothermincola sediminis]|uniref:aminotransferase family protein n=1 Tax=Rhabdothermincola sediminis TaxID=2751370 RepID=UPI001AA08D49|nr:aminotransferase class III-fold pyridoxal phosphate-dependent enzyme [Rhabdothermincola sediminis]